MKKKILALFLVCCLLVAGCGSASASAAAETGTYTPGTYTATAAGIGGDVVVEMTFSATEITSVSITGDGETQGIGSNAVEQLPDAIMKAQSADIDGVSGASVTSGAIKKAAQSCIDQAMGLDTAKTTAISSEETADVIVIGAGGAGLAAAASAAQNGASVIVLEASGIVGGSTIRSGGHVLVFSDEINASMERNDDALAKYLEYKAEDFGEWGETLTTLQEQINEYLASDQTGRFDSVEMALIDHYIKGQGKDMNGDEVTMDFDLLSTAFENATAVNDWLEATGDMELQEKMYNTHGGTPVDGATGLINALQKACDDADVRIDFNTRGTDLIVENDVVTGVTATAEDGSTITYHATKGVVIATGSFSSNGEMAAEYQLMGTGLTEENGSTNPETNQGDGIVMAEAAGAETRDMGFLCTLLAGYHNGCTTKEFGIINGKQQLIVNANGERFMSDAKAGGMATLGGINDQPDGLAYFIGDSKMIDALNEAQEGFCDEMAARDGWFFMADTLEEALEQAGLDVDTTMKTVEDFNSYVDAGNDPDFGRTEFNGKVEEGPFVVVKMEEHYHLTFGGLVINTNAEVLDENGDAIPHLYAAGDVTSGIEGATHQSGDCLTCVLYYGKVAGEQAAMN